MNCCVKHVQRDKKWYIVDAAGKPLGRTAAICATILRGKHKPCYMPNIDNGDYVIVVNVNKAVMTGNKSSKKVYSHHSGYVGNLKQVVYKDMMVKHPTRAFEMAVRGMMPHNTLGRQMFKKMRVYPESNHENEAQQPESVENLNILWSQKIK